MSLWVYLWSVNVSICVFVCEYLCVRFVCMPKCVYVKWVCVYVCVRCVCEMCVCLCEGCVSVSVWYPCACVCVRMYMYVIFTCMCLCVCLICVHGVYACVCAQVSSLCGHMWRLMSKLPSSIAFPPCLLRGISRWAKGCSSLAGQCFPGVKTTVIHTWLLHGCLGSGLGFSCLQLCLCYPVHLHLLMQEPLG